MSNITIETIDQVMARVPNATYAEVKEVLLKTDGDVIEAIILLEEKYKTDSESTNNKFSIYTFGHIISFAYLCHCRI